jgi:ribosomal protein L40E
MDRLKNLGRNRVYTDQHTPSTKVCPRCGAQNELNREYCYSCFASLDYIEPRELHNQTAGPEPGSFDHLGTAVDELGDNGFKQCPNCGQVNSTTQDFCQKCNIRLVYDQPPITIEKEQSAAEDVVNIGSTSPKEGMIDCPHCGIENSTHEVICTSCFKNLYTKDARIRNEIPKSGWRRSPAELRVRHYGYKPCPNCRCENDIRAELCRDCGYEFNQF